ncbi:MAG: hypothetical protein ACKOZU_09850 [Planctomycetaceae bacterium]
MTPFAPRRRHDGVPLVRAPLAIVATPHDAGYATAIVGKWRLGLGEKGKGPRWNGKLAPGPLEIGFDRRFVPPTANDRVPQVFVVDHRVKDLADTWAREAVAWIESRKAGPGRRPARPTRRLQEAAWETVGGRAVEPASR